MEEDLSVESEAHPERADSPLGGNESSRNKQDAGSEEMNWIPHSTLILGPSPESEQAKSLVENSDGIYLFEESSEVYGPRLRLPDGRTLRGLDEIQSYVEQVEGKTTH